MYNPRESVVTWAAAVTGTALAASALSRMLSSSAYITFSGDHLRSGEALVHQALQWHAASVQDTELLFRLRHADFAVAYMNAARATLPDHALEQATGVHVHELAKELDIRQREYAKQLGAKCPAANPSGRFQTASWMRI
jgi:hypothetical protein